MRTTNFIKKNKYIVLLIGASRYNSHKYADIPNVETNIKLMKDLFMDPRYIGVNERNIIVSLNEDSKTIERKITDAKDMAKNSDYTLFVYYSGHGIINPDNYKLYFATSDMDANYLDTDAIEAKAVLEKISRSAASRKIFIVDACHSGGIHNAMGDAPETALMKNFEGVHYVSACDEDSTALFPKKMPDAPTYFTGALISRIHNGMDSDRPYLTLREVVDDIAYDFKYRHNLPVPQQSSVLNADQMPFAINVNCNNAEAAVAPTVSEPESDNVYDEFFVKYANANSAKTKKAKKAAKIAKAGFWTVFATALMFFVFMSANSADHYNNDNAMPAVVSVNNNAPAKNDVETPKRVDNKSKNIRVDDNFDDYSLEKQADLLMKNDEIGNYNVALDLYAKALAVQPYNDKVRAKYDALNNKIDSLFDRYVYMASRYLEGGDFDPEDFKDCINKAEALKSGDPKVYELNQRFYAIYNNGVK